MHACLSAVTPLTTSISPKLLQHSPALPLLGALALLGFAIHSIRLATAGQLPHQVAAVDGAQQQDDLGRPNTLQVRSRGAAG